MKIEDLKAGRRKNFKNNQKRNYLCKKYRLQERHKI